ncbi:MAG: hypothetical protein JWP33_3013, partial [Blastococcus sp.]|nr:hypothetical protein [Blastococcus sp.]MCW2685100.1 hypothetical protein [Blastococcus sp.]
TLWFERWADRTDRLPGRERVDAP